ncbi:hypothetical protein TrLO_g2468 [Triparma laevis f. longispina]|uniref:Uncharacterized protein n=1 Tax=Triparma laevis f. longispina TaxID=1714387 RepID=A0A9W7FK92_9STRA|nr:hypothetical protein TrLO_g2468 [Triparma laevis f. longispina]
MGISSLCCPCRPCCKWQNTEITAWALDASARGAMVISGIFLGVALLSAAKQAAGCELNDDLCGEDPECSGKVYGFKPSSLLSIMGMVVGLLAACTMPIFGAIVDHTNWRWKIGAISACLLVAINVVQSSISQSTWALVAFLQIAAPYIYLVHCVVQYAYLPELTNDKNILSDITAQCNMWQFLTQVFYIIVVVVITTFTLDTSRADLEISTIHAEMNGVMDETIAKYDCMTFTRADFTQANVTDSVTGDVTGVLLTLEGAGDIATKKHDSSISTAQVSQILLVIWSGIFFYIPWAEMFGSRPALHQKPEGESLVMLGFSRIRTTVAQMKTDYNAVFVLLCAIAFAEAAANAFTTIAVTYCDDVLKFTSTETSLLILVCLVCAVPGSILFSKLTKKIGAHKSYMMSLIWWGGVTAIAPIFMNNPDHKSNAYIFGILWGLGFGWIYPTQRALYCLIIPGGQESELMGIYIFAGQILVWLPPAVFTAMNEADVPMPMGMVMLAGFFFIALGIVYGMGDFELAQQKAKESAHLRIMGSSAEKGDDERDTNRLSELDMPSDKILNNDL